jgi:hypothetical protein
VRGKYLLYDVHLFRFHGAYYTKSYATLRSATINLKCDA